MILVKMMDEKKKLEGPPSRAWSENLLIHSEEINTKIFYLGAMRDESLERPSLLLHSCCGPCSTAVIERLKEEFDITVFFYNPNITEAEEYVKRRNTQLQFLTAYNQRFPETTVDYLEGNYDVERFYEAVRGFEDEPEGGKRCTICFQLRLAETAAQAQLRGFEYFGTTLTVSPHKNYALIAKIGGELALSHGVEFLNRDFKKKAGYQRSVELSREYGLYRQNYCGCSFSKWY